MEGMEILRWEQKGSGRLLAQFAIWPSRTYIVNKPVNDLLYQVLLGDELGLRLDLALHLLQVPVDQLAPLQGRLLINCKGPFPTPY